MHWLLPHWFHWLQVFHLNWKVKKMASLQLCSSLSDPRDEQGSHSFKKRLKDWKFYRETLVSALSYDKSQALAFESTVCLSWRFTSFIGHREQLPVTVPLLAAALLWTLVMVQKHLNDCITWNSYYMYDLPTVDAEISYVLSLFCNHRRKGSLSLTEAMMLLNLFVL